MSVVPKKPHHELSLALVNDPVARVDPIVAADLHEASSSLAIAHSSGRIVQYFVASSASGQQHCAPTTWTGGRDSLTVSRVRYVEVQQQQQEPQQQQQHHHQHHLVYLVASTLGGQLLVFRSDPTKIHLVSTVQSGGGAIHDLSQAIPSMSSSSASSLFAACGDGCVRWFSASLTSSNDGDSSVAAAAGAGVLAPATSRALHFSRGNDDDDDDDDFGDDAGFFPLTPQPQTRRRLAAAEAAMTPRFNTEHVFSRLQKATQAVSVAADSARQLMCFTDDIGTVSAYTVQTWSKNKQTRNDLGSGKRRAAADFAWNVSLPTGVGLRVAIVAATNSVVVGTSANDVVFIDAAMGVFGPRFRHHQAPVTALAVSGASVFASGWHDMLRSYTPSAAAVAGSSGGGGGLSAQFSYNEGEHYAQQNDAAAKQQQLEAASAYDYAPGNAKRQTHYHEVVDVVVSSTTGTLFSFAKDGTVMMLPVSQLDSSGTSNSSSSGSSSSSQKKSNRRSKNFSAVYWDSLRGVCIMSACPDGPLVAVAGHKDISFLALKPTHVTPLGSLGFKGAASTTTCAEGFHVKSVHLSRAVTVSALEQVRLVYTAVTTDVGVSVFALAVNSNSSSNSDNNRSFSIAGMQRVFSSFKSSQLTSRKLRALRQNGGGSSAQHEAAMMRLLQSYEMPEAVGVGFTDHACIVASGRSLFRISLQGGAAAADDDENEEQAGTIKAPQGGGEEEGDEALIEAMIAEQLEGLSEEEMHAKMMRLMQEEEMRQQQQQEEDQGGVISPSSSARRSRRRGRNGAAEVQEQEEEHDQEQDEKQHATNGGARKRGRRGRGQNRFRKVQEQVVRYDLDCPIAGAVVAQSNNGGNYSVFVSFTSGASCFIPVCHRTDDLLVPPTSFSSSTAPFKGPRGCIGLSFLPQQQKSTSASGAEETKTCHNNEVVCFSTETMSHMGIRAPTLAQVATAYSTKKNNKQHASSSHHQQQQQLVIRTLSQFLPATSSVVANNSNITQDGVSGKKSFLALGVTGPSTINPLTGKFTALSTASSSSSPAADQLPPLRINSGIAIFPDQWQFSTQQRQQQQQQNGKTVDTDDDGNAKEEVHAVSSSTEKKRELAAVEALGSIAKATVGDLNQNQNQQQQSSGDNVARKEAQARTHVMKQSEPTLFLFQRNIEKAVAELPEMWRVRKFGN